MPNPNTATLRSLREECQRWLGDTTETPDEARIWSDGEIDGYVVKRYKEISLLTRMFFDVRFLDDLPHTGNYTAPWERRLFSAGMIVHNLMSCHFEDERAFKSMEGQSSNHTMLDERDFYLPSGDELPAAVVELPKDLHALERVTWDGRKIAALRQRSLKRADNHYRIVRGDVFGYLVDRDGVRNLRKWKVPTRSAEHYLVSGFFGVLRGSASVVDPEDPQNLTMHIDEFGVVFAGASEPDQPPGVFNDFFAGTVLYSEFGDFGGLGALPEFEACTVVYRFGILRRLPGYFPSNGPWGLVRRLSQDGHNTRVEFYRRGQEVEEATDRFEIQDHYLIYVRHGVLADAFGRRGPGQDLKMAAHFARLYAAGVARLKDRIEVAYRMRVVRSGGSGMANRPGRRPHAILPRHMTSE